MTFDTISKRGRGRPARITRESILVEAIKLPTGELTMPALATALRVKTPALYHHFGSRADLVQAVSQRVFKDMPLATPDPQHWRRWMHRTMMDLYRFILENPLLIEAFDVSDGYLWTTLDLCEACLETLQGAGFDEQQSYLILLSLSQIATGAARTRLEGQTTDLVRGQVTKEAQGELESRPRAARFIESLNQQSNIQWVEELLQWTIDCIPAFKSTLDK